MLLLEILLTMKLDSEGESLLGELLGVKLHGEEDLEEKHGDGQEPVHVSVGVVEGNSSGVRGDNFVVATFRHLADRSILVGGRPRVEDPEVVVRGDKCD